MKKKIVAFIVAMVAVVAMTLTAVQPAYAWDYFNNFPCDGGSSSLTGTLGVNMSNPSNDFNVDMYGNVGNRSWDWWLYRDGVEVKHGHVDGGPWYEFRTINNTAGDNWVKFRFASADRSINCAGSVKVTAGI